MRQLFIRVDAGGAIGTGHVMRMIALAQGWVDRATEIGDQCFLDVDSTSLHELPSINSEPVDSRTEVVFICAKLPGPLQARLQDEGFTVVRINAEPGTEEDLRWTLTVIKKQLSGNFDQETGVDEIPSPHPLFISQASSFLSGRQHYQPKVRISSIQGGEYSKKQLWLIVDGYNFDYDYQKKIKQNADLSLLCVDDHGYSERWYCDAILNQNLDSEKRIDYLTELPDTRLLLGASFCLLRREFLQKQLPEKEWGRIRSLLVTLGGSDPDNATGAILQLLHQACVRPLDIRILLGADNPNLIAIQAFESHHRIKILQGVNNMAIQYAWADGIISAGGSTCWEWLYFGLPGAIVTIAENQIPIVKALSEKRETALDLGRVCEFDKKHSIKTISEWLESPALSLEKLVALSLIDGKGSLRVVEFLMNRIYR